MYIGYDCKKKFGSFDDVFMCYLLVYYVILFISICFFLKFVYIVNVLNIYICIINFLKLYCFGIIKIKIILFVI